MSLEEERRIYTKNITLDPNEAILIIDYIIESIDRDAGQVSTVQYDNVFTLISSCI